jgi:hypothetical protein
MESHNRKIELHDMQPAPHFSTHPDLSETSVGVSVRMHSCVRARASASASECVCVCVCLCVCVCVCRHANVKFI